MSQQQISRYSGVAMFLHWLTVLLVIAAFILGPGGGEERVYAAARDTQRHLHETLGLTVFFLTVIRLLWRWRDRQPELPSLPRQMALAARAVQYTLYILLFLVPVTAILGAWLEGHPISLVLGIEIGPWFGPAHELGVDIAHVHGFLGDTIIWLAGFHALAGIYHQLVRKDEVLTSMLPRMFAAQLTRKG